MRARARVRTAAARVKFHALKYPVGNLARAIKNVLTREGNIWIAAMFVASIDDSVKVEPRKTLLVFVMPAAAV